MNTQIVAGSIGVVDGNDVVVRLFASYEAAQRYAENKNNEAR